MHAHFHELTAESNRLTTGTDWAELEHYHLDDIVCKLNLDASTHDRELDVAFQAIGPLKNRTTADETQTNTAELRVARSWTRFPNFCCSLNAEAYCRCRFRTSL